MRRRGPSKKRQRNTQLSELKYPHYTSWAVRRYLVRAGAIVQLEGKTYRIKQVIQAVIAGDTPSLVLEEVNDASPEN